MLQQPTSATIWTLAGSLSDPDPITGEQEGFITGEDAQGNAYAAYGTFQSARLIDVYDVCQTHNEPEQEADFEEWVRTMEQQEA